MRPASLSTGLPEGRDQDLDGLLTLVARGDEGAFASRSGSRLSSVGA
jgi:hypothetical protein